MGALRKGEIIDITKHFPPDIAIVTTLDRQHIGIFGSKEQLFEAKSEIVFETSTLLLLGLFTTS